MSKINNKDIKLNVNIKYQQAAQSINEDQDAAGWIDTKYTMSVGDEFKGNVGFLYDVDWVEISLNKDIVYNITLSGADGGGGTLIDPDLFLYNSLGEILYHNDDGGSGWDSSLNLSVSTSGVYYLSADSAWGSTLSTGTYTLSISEGGNIPDPQPNPGPIVELGTVYTYDQIAYQLTDGYWETIGLDRRAFSVQSGGTITVDITNLGADGKQLARWALDSWGKLTGIDFSEVSNNGQISFFDTDYGAYSDSSVSGSEITHSIVNVSTDWLSSYGATIDSYGFQTYIHEIGHALGLGHAGNYNGSATYGIDNGYENDSWQASIMSYFDQEDNTYINGSYAYVTTPMLSDILAIQELYSNVPSYAGDTVWGDGSNINGYIGQLFSQILSGKPQDSEIYGGSPVTLTVHDSSGLDLINLTSDVNNQRVNLKAEGISDIMGLRGNLVISRETIIENFQAGSGNDWVSGNSVGNCLWGNSGDDIILGRAGADKIFGGMGTDRLVGDGGRDKLNGGADNDCLVGGKGKDLLTGGKGSDMFVFKFVSDSGVGVSADRIIDFDRSQGDKIDFSKLDGNASLPGFQLLTFVGANQFSSAGDLRFHNGRLSADTDGNGSADFEIILGSGITLELQDLII